MKFSLHKCHKCGSSNLSGGQYDGDVDTVWQKVDCEDCGASRTETYLISTVESNDDDAHVTLWSRETDKEAGK